MKSDIQPSLLAVADGQHSFSASGQRFDWVVDVERKLLLWLLFCNEFAFQHAVGGDEVAGCFKLACRNQLGARHVEAGMQAIVHGQREALLPISRDCLALVPNEALDDAQLAHADQFVHEGRHLGLLVFVPTMLADGR
ncbi:hypothetical protein D3C81_1308650 [compost metagenome]